MSLFIFQPKQANSVDLICNNLMQFLDDFSLKYSLLSTLIKLDIIVSIHLIYSYLVTLL